MSWNLHLLLPLMLVPAKLLGVAGRKIGIPSVVGEIAAGLILGPAMLGLLPDVSMSTGADGLFREFAQIGLCVLLFRVGLETDLSEFARIGRRAVGVAIAGMFFPFVLGAGAGLALGWSPMLSAFAGATLTATSIGVTASVLEEIGKHSSDEGRIIMGAAVLDDVFGLLVLAAMVALVTPGEGVMLPVTKALIEAILFVGAGIWLGPLLVKGFMRVSAWAGRRAVLLVLAFAYLLVMAWVAHAIGLAMIIGAYAAGLAFGGHSEHEQLKHDLRPLIELLTPLFFILIGASIELSGFDVVTSEGRAALLSFALLVTVAVAGKLMSSMFVGGGLNRLAIGSGMMPRGEVGFVFAQVGLSSQLFNAQQYSTLTLVLIVTTVLGPLLLRFSWRQDGYEGRLPKSAANDNHPRQGPA